MGYTHYWTTVDTPASHKYYLKACPIIARILKRHIGMIQYEVDNCSLPVVTPERIRFNGIGEDGHETFLFEIGRDDFCKTERKPYDIVVCECLLVLKAFIPLMRLNSDGFSAVDEDNLLDGAWEEARYNVCNLYGIESKKITKKREISHWYDGKAGYRDCVNILCYQTVTEAVAKKKIEIVEVNSRSEPGTKHKVARLINGDVVCTCKGFEYRKTCRHIKEAGF